MNTTKTIEFQGITLPETTFAGAEVGRDYVTVQGYKVTVVGIQADSHALIRTAKGKDLRTKADARCYGPIPFEAPVTEDAAPAPKRKRDMTIDDLRAEYLRVVGRETGSSDRRYLLWKLSEAAKGKVTVGAIEKRAPRDKAEMQVLPLTLLRETTRLLDAAVAASGAKSRSAFVRAALIEKLRAVGGDEAIAAADALSAEAG